jgi:transcriptional regulator with XRE-family HTH domain
MSKDEFGKRLRQARRTQDITQEELAYSVGVKTSTISNFERGKNYPSVDVLIKVADSLNISIDSLLISK